MPWHLSLLETFLGGPSLCRVLLTMSWLTVGLKVCRPSPLLLVLSSFEEILSEPCHNGTLSPTGRIADHLQLEGICALRWNWCENRKWNSSKDKIKSCAEFSAWHPMPLTAPQFPAWKSWTTSGNTWQLWGGQRYPHCLLPRFLKEVSLTFL